MESPNLYGLIDLSFNATLLLLFHSTDFLNKGHRKVELSGKTFESLLSGLTAVSFGHVVLKLSLVAMRMRKNVNDQKQQI